MGTLKEAILAKQQHLRNIRNKMAMRAGSSMLLRSLRSSPVFMSSRAMSEMPLTFAAPNAVHYDKVNVSQVDVPTLSGSFGILPKHVPSLAVLSPGIVRVLEADGKEKRFFASSGTVTMNEDGSLQILAEEAHDVENLDRAAAQQVLQEANSNLAAAKDEVSRAEAQIAVEVAEAVVKAIG